MIQPKILSTLLLLLGATSAFAGSTTLTTYYPAPNGNYDNLTVNTALTAKEINIPGGGRIASSGIIAIEGDVTFNGGFTSQGGLMDADNLSAGEFTAQSFTFNGSTIKLANAGVDFNLNNASLLNINSKGIALPNQKNIYLEGGKLAISSNAAVNRTRTILFPIDLTDTTENKKIAFNNGNNTFTGLGGTSNSLEFHAATQGNANAGMVLKNGNLGIGNTDPAERLQVNGNARVDGNLAINNITSTSLIVKKGAATVAGMDNEGVVTGKIKISKSSGCPNPCSEGLMWLEN